MLTLSSATQIPHCNGLLHPSDNSDVYTFSSTVKPGYLEITLHNYRLLYYFSIWHLNLLHDIGVLEQMHYNVPNQI